MTTRVGAVIMIARPVYNMQIIIVVVVTPAGENSKTDHNNLWVHR